MVVHESPQYIVVDDSPPPPPRPNTVGHVPPPPSPRHRQVAYIEHVQGIPHLVRPSSGGGSGGGHPSSGGAPAPVAARPAPQSRPAGGPSGPSVAGGAAGGGRWWVISSSWRGGSILSTYWGPHSYTGGGRPTARLWLSPVCGALRNVQSLMAQVKDLRTQNLELQRSHQELSQAVASTVGISQSYGDRMTQILSKLDLHVVYTPGPVNPVGDFLSRWAYPANPALGDVSIHGTAQAAGDVRDMMAAEREELLARPLVFRAVVAPVVTRSKAAPRAQGAPACDPPPLASPPVGGGTKQKRKLRRLERIVKIRKSWKSHKKATPIHGDDAPNAFEINWAKHYPNCQRYKQMWQDALNGSFQDGVRLVDNKLVRNGRSCVPTPLVHCLVAEYHDAFHLTTSSVEKHWKEINHGVEGEGLHKAVELQCQTCPSCAIDTHDTKRKQGYMTPMPIPMEPMDSIALDVFHYPSTSHDGEVYDRMLLCVCRLSGYLIAIPIPKPRHEDKDEGLTGRRAAHLVMERWVDRFGAPREICTDRGPQFVSQYFQTLCSKIGARSTMCLAGRHQGNGKAENTGKQLRRAVAKAITLKKKKTNWVEVLPAVVRAWHETTGPSGYTPNEIVFGKHNRTKGPPLAEPKGVAQDAAHYYQRREELIALARRAMIQVQETMARKYNNSRRMSPKFLKRGPRMGPSPAQKSWR